MISRTMPLDPYTGCLVTIDEAHRELHDGDHYSYFDSVTIANNGTQDYLIQTIPTRPWIHFVFDADGTAITQFQLYEGADRTPTTLQSPINNNRNSNHTPTVKVYKGQTAGTTDGTLILQYKSGTSSGPSTRTNSAYRSDSEIILKQGITYIFRVTSGTDGNLVNVSFKWYEN